MSEGNGDLLARVVQLIAEVQQTNKRLDGYILQNDAWRRETDGWRREISQNMRIAAETLHATGNVLRQLDRRVSKLEERPEA